MLTNHPPDGATCVFVSTQYCNNNNSSTGLAIGTRSAFFFNESRRTKVQKHYYSREKVCQVEHFKTFRKAIGPVLGL